MCFYAYGFEVLFSNAVMLNDQLSSSLRFIIHLLMLSCSDGMNGFIYITDKPVSPMEIFSPVDDMEIITNNKVMYAFCDLLFLLQQESGYPKDTGCQFLIFY